MQLQLSEEAKEQRRLYKRKWRERNREKVVEAERSFWERKATQAKEVKHETSKADN